jgi:DMSO/TMAO reductase YedYZ molybdopterin-dependent catalytic subunit
MMTPRTRRAQTHGLATILVLGILGFNTAVQSQTKTGAAPQTSARTESSVVLEVGGEVPHPLSLSSAEFAKLPRQSVRATGHDGVESQFEGVALSEILSRAGVPSGRELRGKAVALYLLVEASDGYRAVFALAELDSSFTDRVILLADRRAGQPLNAHDGPLQIIVPGEKKHARWVRQVIRLKIGRA